MSRAHERRIARMLHEWRHSKPPHSMGSKANSKTRAHETTAGRLAAQLRARRATLNWTQKFVAAEAEVAQPTISRLEDDPSGSSIETLDRVARKLGLELTLKEAA